MQRLYPIIAALLFSMVLLSLAWGESFSSFHGCGKYRVRGLLKESSRGMVLEVYAESMSAIELELGYSAPSDTSKLHPSVFSLPQYWGQRVEVLGDIVGPIMKQRGVLYVQRIERTVPRFLEGAGADGFVQLEKKDCAKNHTAHDLH